MGLRELAVHHCFENQRAWFCHGTKLFVFINLSETDSSERHPKGESPRGWPDNLWEFRRISKIVCAISRKIGVYVVGTSVISGIKRTEIRSETPVWRSAN